MKFIQEEEPNGVCSTDFVHFPDDGFDIKSEQEVVRDDEKRCIQNSKKQYADHDKC